MTEVIMRYSGSGEDSHNLERVGELVRCRDCKHQVKEWRTDKRYKDNGYTACGCDVVGDACGFWALLGQDDDYCSYGQRKEET